MIVEMFRGIKNTLHKDPDFSGQEFKKVSQNAKNFINGKVAKMFNCL